MDFFNFFQFTSLFLFIGIFIGRSVWLQQKGIKIFLIGKEKSSFKITLEIIFMAILILWSFEIIHHSLGLQFTLLPEFLSEVFYESLILKVVGVILISAGLVIFILALIAFGNSWRIGIDTNNPGKLVTSGIFSYTRNPVFIFFNLYFFGTALIYSNLFFTILAVMAILGINFHILNEEKFLKKIYGEIYTNYCKNVKRYF